MPYNGGVQSVIETSIFARRADALLTREEKMELIGLLAADPLAGDVIPGTGGVRKLRFAASGRGKSGAYRVIYYVLDEDQPILALLIYGKGERVEMSPEQRRAVSRLAAEMKAQGREGAKRRP
jgi:mRNA-degrading endonuclease RelE of RelBE toxin-antitoxin system